MERGGPMGDHDIGIDHLHVQIQSLVDRIRKPDRPDPLK